MTRSELIEAMATAMHDRRDWIQVDGPWAEMPADYRAKSVSMIEAALSVIEQAGMVVVPAEFVDRVRQVLRCEYEAAGYGLHDCVDNEGKAYQSAHLAAQIAALEPMLSEAGRIK